MSGGNTLAVQIKSLVDTMSGHTSCDIYKLSDLKELIALSGKRSDSVRFTGGVKSVYVMPTDQLSPEIVSHSAK